MIMSALILTASLYAMPAEMIVSAMAAASGVDARTATCIACAESGWDARAVGDLGERGWFQLHPQTWAWAREKMGADASFDLAFDPVENTRTALWLLRHGYGTWWSTWSRCRGPA